MSYILYNKDISDNDLNVNYCILKYQFCEQQDYIIISLYYYF